MADATPALSSDSATAGPTAAAGPKPGPLAAAAAGGGTEPVPAKQAAHRLPTGAYPAVTEKSASMRPRTEAEPEPADLFRPASERPSRAPGEARPTSSDGKPSTAPPETATATAASGRPAEVEATVKVGAVRPSSATEATVLAPAVERPQSREASSVGTTGDPPPEADGNGSDGKDHASGSTSTPRFA